VKEVVFGDGTGLICRREVGWRVISLVGGGL